MAVYTHVDQATIEQLFARIPEAGAPRALEGIAAGSINTMYRVETDQGDRWLRINEGKPRAAVAYEAAVLEVLATSQLPFETPRLLARDDGVRLLPVPLGGDLKLACLFAPLSGRELEPSEVTGDHVAQVGEAIARAHAALSRMRGRPNPFGAPVVTRWLHGLEGKMDAALHARMTRALGSIDRARRPLRRGIVHGDLFRDNTKWVGDKLIALFDWEMAGSDHLALDLGVCINAWCFDGAELSLPRARSLVSGYERRRALDASEVRGLFDEARFAAVRFTLSRYRDFELSGATGARDHLDYREYLGRLDALNQLGARAFRAEVVGR